MVEVTDDKGGEDDMVEISRDIVDGDQDVGVQEMVNNYVAKAACGENG